MRDFSMYSVPTLEVSLGGAYLSIYKNYTLETNESAIKFFSKFLSSEILASLDNIEDINVERLQDAVKGQLSLCDEYLNNAGGEVRVLGPKTNDTTIQTMFKIRREGYNSLFKLELANLDSLISKSDEVMKPLFTELKEDLINCFTKFEHNNELVNKNNSVVVKDSLSIENAYDGRGFMHKDSNELTMHDVRNVLLKELEFLDSLHDEILSTEGVFLDKLKGVYTNSVKSIRDNIANVYLKFTRKPTVFLDIQKDLSKRINKCKNVMSSDLTVGKYSKLELPIYTGMRKGYWESKDILKTMPDDMRNVTNKLSTFRKQLSGLSSERSGKRLVLTDLYDMEYTSDELREKLGELLDPTKFSDVKTLPELLPNLDVMMDIFLVHVKVAEALNKGLFKDFKEEVEETLEYLDGWLLANSDDNRYSKKALGNFKDNLITVADSISLLGSLIEIYRQSTIMYIELIERLDNLR